ncbi:uncharacterized protein LOC110909696 isoform X2 [Helianthus annuus]|uniref:uncharacterized protein LOC110909696 isoform X2 n=1 Tax=Helianthus annuus TaxID=4232 RepID=UPI000B90907E|nr:uncharacterized protein LOC110909696 isoform X2 [Helianthus annuus]
MSPWQIDNGKKGSRGRGSPPGLAAGGMRLSRTRLFITNKRKARKSPPGQSECNKEKEPSNDGDSSGVSHEYIVNMWRSSVFHNHDRCRCTLSREQKLAPYYNRILERMARDEAKIVDVSTAEDRAATRALINRWFNYVPSDNSETEEDSTDSD